MQFKGMGKAAIFGKGKFLKPDGDFRIEITNAFSKKTQTKGFAFIMEFDILDSNLDSQPAGGSASWYQSLQDENIAYPAIKEMLVALFGIDQSDDAEFEEFNESVEELMENAGDDKWENMSKEKLEKEEHPLVGMTVCVSTYMKKTKADKDFTVHEWSHDDSEETED